jgi:hypothetical protein
MCMRTFTYRPYVDIDNSGVAWDLGTWLEQWRVSDTCG